MSCIAYVPQVLSVGGVRSRGGERAVADSPLGSGADCDVPQPQPAAHAKSLLRGSGLCAVSARQTTGR